jgi:hypothetical protein
VTGHGERWSRIRANLRWLPSYGLQRVSARRDGGNGKKHLILAVADHFEPSFVPEAPRTLAPIDIQIARLERWCRELPRLVSEVRDADGRPFRHTYFYPAEQYDAALLERLAAHCHDGWGEVEVHLHHGVQVPDTSDGTRRVLSEFRDLLVGHGLLSSWEGDGVPRYAFVHGNWALANSSDGRFCGVDDELAILSETGCYADFTLPSAPDRAQVSTVNSMYECSRPLHERAAHRRGERLAVGRRPAVFPLIIQGPLALEFSRPGIRAVIPRIENSELSGRRPITAHRLERWRRTAVTVSGRPDWVFIKLHCHGMDARDLDEMLGPARMRSLATLQEFARSRGDTLHFVSTREMVNIVLAACDGRDGNPGDYRDYRLRLLRPAATP